MKPMDFPITHDLTDIRRKLTQDAAAFIDEEETHYERQVEQTAAAIAAATHGCQIVWQCGPSSVGKTTTAKRICAALETRGVQAVVISLDDFYRGREQAPRLPDGTFDYESPQALDLPRLHTCIRELLENGETLLPRYDFTAGAPGKQTTYLHIAGDTAVIFEGIHAFTPEVAQTATDAATPPMRLFLNTRSRFTDGEEVLLSRREIRLSRRLLRDERTRNSSFERTMTMWQQVLRGDDLYIFPYYKQADLTVDTTLGYEPCVLAPLMLERLPALVGTPFEQDAMHLQAVYERFPRLSLDTVPADSVLREFIGRR